MIVPPAAGVLKTSLDDERRLKHNSSEREQQDPGGLTFRARVMSEGTQ